MRKWITITLFFISGYSFSQEVAEQQLENLTVTEEAETEDDSYLQQLEHLKKDPLNLNTADAAELKELRILTDLQIMNLLSYRKIFGRIIDIYELQAVPGWDIYTIKKLLPFITVAIPFSVKEDMRKRLKGGTHSFLFRISQVLEKSKGFDNSITGTKYEGSSQRLFFRYRYNYKNLLQYGIVGDKDAGEQFFKGTQKQGFDFYSFHFFIRKAGVIKELALGDFTVNMGQGLIQWQSLAFKKSVDVMSVKRQSAVLRPYNSAGEFSFNRGTGITLQKGKIMFTGFASVRKLSTNIIADTVNYEDYFSSFQTSGYHRTQNEIADRNNLRQTSYGATIKYTGNRWHTSVNGVWYHFSTPMQKRDEPYNMYAITGNKWNNLSADYSYTYRNLHFFGEAAVDKHFNKAFINGVMLSADAKTDISFVYRNISRNYQAVNGNAFTESTYPVNERGLYTGISIRPATPWRIDAYADVYSFPWLKYLADAPSEGRDFLIQLTYTPSKLFELYTRYKNERKQGNEVNNTTVNNYLVQLPKENWRVHFNYKLNKEVTIRNRVELLWYRKDTPQKETGFLTYGDVLYNPLKKPLSVVLRLQYFETTSYNSRLYAYENDVLYSYSIPVFFDKGFRYYTTLNYDPGKKVSVWFRLGQTIYADKKSTGSGLDEITGKRKTELKLQMRVLL